MNPIDETADVTKTVVLSGERRQFDRLPPIFESVAVRTRAGESIAARVENVSLGGIGLQLASDDGISANDDVDIIYLYAALPPSSATSKRMPMASPLPASNGNDGQHRNSAVR